MDVRRVLLSTNETAIEEALTDYLLVVDSAEAITAADWLILQLMKAAETTR